MCRNGEEIQVPRTEVRRAGEGDAPEEFLWEGHIYRVRAVLSHHSSQAKREDAGQSAGADETWRVRANAGRSGHSGVFDLRLDWTAGRWTVTRITLEGKQ